ncbi:unnamed protein product [Caretta caretta]
MPGKQPSDSKSARPVRKRKKIDLEQKMKIVKKYEGGQSLSSIARELNLATSTVKSILNDSARIKEHMKGSALLKSTVITKQRSGAIYEMEKLLTMWMEDQIQKRVPLSLMIIQAKAKSIFEDVKAVEATGRETGKTLRDFWKSYNIYQAIINIAKAWAEVTQVCLNAVWKKACPQFVRSFKGFEKDETYEEVADEIVKLAEQLELEVDVGDVDELIESHGAELSNEDLMELEAAKVKEQTEAEDEVEEVEEPRHFSTKQMALAFREIDSAMARFEKMDPNSSRFLKVNRGIDETLACYRQMYEEKKKATIQSSLYKFVRKVERSATSTSPQPSTSKTPSDDSDDIMPFSSFTN